jgi:hypothetical protein
MTRFGFRLLGAGMAVVAMMSGDLIDSVAPLASFVGEAQATVGNPLTPGSVAGVARRTTRRTIRRSTIYVTRLPAACVKTSVSGVVLWHCGGTYYQAYNGRYVVVHIH